MNPQANDSTRIQPGDPACRGDPRLGRRELRERTGLTGTGMAIAASGTASVRSRECARGKTFTEPIDANIVGGATFVAAKGGR